MEKRALALDWLVKRLLSSLKKKQVPLEEKRDYKRGGVHAHTNRVITMEDSSIKVYFLVK